VRVRASACECEREILFVVPKAPSVIVHQEQDRGIVKKCERERERDSETNFEIGGHTLTNMMRERVGMCECVCVCV
jgi:hypothetical protein